MASKQVTRFMAEYAAKGMRDKVWDELIKNSRARMTEYANKLVTKYVPMIILTDKAKGYLEDTPSLTFKCNESTVRIWGIQSYPKLKPITLPRSEFEKISELKKVYDQRCSQSVQFYKKCVDTILELKTVKRTEREFPEAIEFLPKESVATPNDNIAFLKQSLKT